MKYTVLTRNGCPYCDVMKDYLNEAGIQYSEERSMRGYAPALINNETNKTIFKGLPDMGDLISFISSEKGGQ